MPTDFLHDFVHIYWPSVRAVMDGRIPEPGYHVGPFLLVELWFFGLFPLAVAKWLWFASSILEVAALAFFSRQLLPQTSAKTLRIATAALGLGLLTCVPVLDSLDMGQLGVMAALGVVFALWFLTSDDGPGEVEAGIILGVTIAAKPSWLLWILVLPALRKWKALAVAVLSIFLAHLSACLLFGFSAMWDVTLLSVERVLALRDTIMNAPDSQHVAHVAQRWMHKISGSDAGDAAARLAYLTPASIAIGAVALGTLVVRGSRDVWLVVVTIAAFSPFVVATSWPLDFCVLPVAQAVTLTRALDARRSGRRVAGLLLLAFSFASSNIVLRALSGGASTLGGSTLLAALSLFAAALLTRPESRPHPRAAPI